MSFNDRLDPNQRFHVSVQPGMTNESSDGGKIMIQRYYLNAYAPLYDVAHKKALDKINRISIKARTLTVSII